MIKQDVTKRQVWEGIKLNKISLEKSALVADGFITIGGLFTLLYWLTGKGLFYSDTQPVLSPFTSFSLMLMAGSRWAEKVLETWSKPMTLALLGVVACGNISSLWIQIMVPDLFLHSMPNVVPTSNMTSIGLISFCFYQIITVIRKTPYSAFIFDDILLHLALFPGGISLLGHIFHIPSYLGTQIDPRAGIGYLEMAFMGTYAIAAVISNPDLFLWKFLSENIINRLTFFILFVNQYVAPIVVGLIFRPQNPQSHEPGIEFFVILAGVLATLVFLSVHAIFEKRSTLTASVINRL